jgi:hypothetical protein
VPRTYWPRSYHKPERKQSLQVRANAAVHRAIKRGELVRGPCEVCGATDKVHAHHESYEPEAFLDVRWLCWEHHLRRHGHAPRPRPSPPSRTVLYERWMRERGF